MFAGRVKERINVASATGLEKYNILSIINNILLAKK